MGIGHDRITVRLPEGRTMAEELRVQTYRGTVKRYPAHATESLLRDYAVRSLEALGAEDRVKVLARVKGCDATTCDLETLLTLLAFMGSEWEARGKAAGDRIGDLPGAHVAPVLLQQGLGCGDQRGAPLVGRQRGGTRHMDEHMSEYSLRQAGL